VKKPITVVARSQLILMEVVLVTDMAVVEHPLLPQLLPLLLLVVEDRHHQVHHLEGIRRYHPPTGRVLRLLLLVGHHLRFIMMVMDGLVLIVPPYPIICVPLAPFIETLPLQNS
jgi:hypothetical protein